MKTQIDKAIEQVKMGFDPDVVSKCMRINEETPDIKPLMKKAQDLGKSIDSLLKSNGGNKGLMKIQTAFRAFFKVAKGVHLSRKNESIEEEVTDLEPFMKRAQALGKELDLRFRNSKGNPGLKKAQTAYRVFFKEVKAVHLSNRNENVDEAGGSTKESRFSLYFDLVSDEDGSSANEMKAYRAMSKMLGIPLDNEGHDDAALIVNSKSWLDWDDVQKIRGIIDKNDTTINDGVVDVNAPGDYMARNFRMYAGHAGTNNFWSYDGNDGKGDWDDMAEEYGD